MHKLGACLPQMHMATPHEGPSLCRGLPHGCLNLGSLFDVPPKKVRGLRVSVYGLGQATAMKEFRVAQAVIERRQSHTCWCKRFPFLLRGGRIKEPLLVDIGVPLVA